MTSAQVQIEIDELLKQVDKMKADLVLADGAIQAFKWMLEMVKKEEAAAPSVDAIPAYVAEPAPQGDGDGR